MKIENITKIYSENGHNKQIFSDFSLEIEAGSKIGIFGPNGSGKTTLLNIISGTDRKFDGRVDLNGSKPAYMHQDSGATLAPWFSAEQNIILARKYHRLSLEKGRSLLNHLIKELQINFSCKEYPPNLSGGQRQLVALLRVLICEPDILLLDEPFAALDVEKRQAVSKVFQKQLKPKTTMIIVSHRGGETWELIDRAIILNGRPVAITNEFFPGDFEDREDFETAVSAIGFNAKKIDHEND